MFFRLTKITKKRYKILLAALGLSIIIVFFRSLGILQGLEWNALDFLFTHRFLVDSSQDKVVLVTLSEKDIKNLQEYPLSDRSVVNLIKKINTQKPRVIGLDLFRNFPIPSLNNDKKENYQAYSDLQKLFRKTNNLYGIAKLTDSYSSPKIDPPNVLKETGGYGAADLLVDDDGVVRRGYLFPITNKSPDSAIPSLGLAVALHYLSDEHIYPTVADFQSCPIANSLNNKKLKFENTQTGWLKLNNKVFCPFTGNDGGYVGADDYLNGSGYQILLNWRSCHHKFLSVSVSDVLNDKIQENLLKNKIVLIGNASDNYKDSFLTSCSQDKNVNSDYRMLGVEIQANLVSQIIGTALDKSSPLKFWSNWQEFIWIFIWTIPTILQGYRHCDRNPLELFYKVFSIVVASSIVLIAIGYVAFNFSWWIPVVTPLISIVAAGILTSLFIYITKLVNVNSILENRVKERTQKLELKNEQLAQVFYQLKNTRRQMIARERLESLGKNVAGIAHEIRNPLNLINQYNALSIDSGASLHKEIDKNSSVLDAEIVEKLSEFSAPIIENLESSKQQIERIARIISSVIEQTGKNQEKPILANINELVDDALKQAYFSFKSSHKNFKTNVETHYDRAIDKIYIYPGDFSRAIINLVDNACYAVHQKSQKSKDYVPNISVTTKDLGNSLKIIVRDNGIGIPVDKEGEIFKEFVTTKTNGDGVGLGLFIVKEIIEGKHQGKIEVNVGKYTTFALTIPKSIPLVHLPKPSRSQIN
jgi:CHASE2 domain-containing sensor protein